MECLNCKKEVQQTPKKRTKLYCSQKCRVEYCRTKKAAGKPKNGRGRPKKIDAAKLNEQVREERERRSNPLINAARGCDANGVNLDEAKLAEKDNPEMFMGHKIPKGLKGIDLSIWKAEIKEKNK